MLAKMTVIAFSSKILSIFAKKTCGRETLSIYVDRSSAVTYLHDKLKVPNIRTLSIDEFEDSLHAQP